MNNLILQSQFFSSNSQNQRNMRQASSVREKDDDHHKKKTIHEKNEEFRLHMLIQRESVCISALLAKAKYV